MTIHYFALDDPDKWAMFAVLAVIPYLAKRAAGGLWR